MSVAQFDQLPFASQLLLWIMRHLVYAAEMNNPLSQRVTETYRAGGRIS